MKGTKITFNFICYIFVLISKALLFFLSFVLIPIWIVPFLLWNAFDENVKDDYRYGRKWWIKSWNKEPKS